MFCKFIEKYFLDIKKILLSIIFYYYFLKSKKEKHFNQKQLNENNFIQILYKKIKSFLFNDNFLQMNRFVGVSDFDGELIV